MLIEFRGESTPNVVMFGKIAKQLLGMMGQSSNTEGAILAPDVPQALTKLTTALQAVPDQDVEDEDGESEISIHTRAVPLIKLLEECVKEDSYMKWQLQ